MEMQTTSPPITPPTIAPIFFDFLGADVRFVMSALPISPNFQTGREGEEIDQPSDAICLASATLNVSPGHFVADIHY